MLTNKENGLRVYLKILLYLNILFLIFGFINLISPGTLSNLSIPFVIGLITLFFIDVLMYWYSIADLRRFSILVKLLIWQSVLSALILIYMLIWHNEGDTVLLINQPLNFSTALICLLIYNIINAVILILFLSSAEKARYGLKYFSPLQFKTLEALAEVIIYGEKEILSGEEVSKNVDTYFNSFQAKSKWTMALVITVLYFYPILSLLPPLPYMSPERRLQFLKKRFYRDVEARLIPEFWRVIVQGLIRIAKQMCYIGYYNDKRTFASVGYIPFSERKDKEERLKKSQLVKSPPLYVKSEKDIQADSVEGDVIIIGSGAAASILAKGLIEKGRKVLMVERGNHEVPETFNENEMEMVSRLFQDGAIQAARDFRFTVFQGSCVGGSTVLNNAVCFKMPEPVLDRWNNELKVGLNKAEVMKSMDKVWDLINTENMVGDKTTDNLNAKERIRLNPGGYLFEEGCQN